MNRKFFKNIAYTEPLKMIYYIHLQPINEYCRDKQYKKQGLNKNKIIPYTVAWIISGIQFICLNVLQN